MRAAHALLVFIAAGAAVAQPVDDPPPGAASAPPTDSAAPDPAPSEPPPTAPVAEGEPSADAAPPAAALEATPPPAPPPRAARARLRRIAVQRVEATAVPDRLVPLFTAALVTELRKLHGVSVIGMDEVQALLEVEANRQILGCPSDGCTAELADALGADSIVTARLARIGDESVVSFRRLDAADGSARGHDRRLAASDGEELLAEVGPAVAALFTEHPLRVGAERGVDKEIGRRLNPPPVPVWMFATTAGVTGVALATGATAGLVSLLLSSSVQARVDGSVQTPVDGGDLKLDFDRAQRAAIVSNVAWVIGGVGVVTTGVLALFTDFWGFNDAE